MKLTVAQYDKPTISIKSCELVRSVKLVRWLFLHVRSAKAKKICLWLYIFYGCPIFYLSIWSLKTFVFLLESNKKYSIKICNGIKHEDQVDAISHSLLWFFAYQCAEFIFDGFVEEWQVGRVYKKQRHHYKYVLFCKKQYILFISHYSRKWVTKVCLELALCFS